MSGIGQTNFLQSLGWAVLNSLWQMALLWVVYQLLTGIFKKARPAAKSVLASGLLITGFVWFLFTFISVYLYRISSEGAEVASTFAYTQGDERLNNWLQQTLPVASIMYLVLLVFPVLHFSRNYRYVQTIRNYGLGKMNVEWRMFVNNVSARMGIKKPVQVWISELVSSPVTIGYLKPVILVPLAAVNHLTPQQLEAVLLHELSHIKRFDYLFNLIINFIQAILYFNPFVKAFVKIVEREREKSCDEMVLQFQYDSHDYASALLLLERVSQTHKPLTLAASGTKKHELLTRVELIMGVQKKPVFSFNKLAGLMAGLLCIIALNALLIISKPLNGEQAASFARLATPFGFGEMSLEEPAADETPEVKAPKPVAAASEMPAATIINQPSTLLQLQGTAATEAEAIHKEKAAEDKKFQHYAEIANNFQNDAAAYALAGYYMDKVAPELKKYQEEQVRQALENSKKVLENTQWKAVEKTIADAFTQQEKVRIKEAYDKEINKFNWKEWENKLRGAYDKVDWDRVNNQLNNAVNMIRIDSLQKVYNEVAVTLGAVQKEMTALGENGIPDTDITLKAVEDKQKDVMKALNNLKAVKAKKIVHL